MPRQRAGIYVYKRGRIWWTRFRGPHGKPIYRSLEITVEQPAHVARRIAGQIEREVLEGLEREKPYPLAEAFAQLDFRKARMVERGQMSEETLQYTREKIQPVLDYFGQTRDVRKLTRRDLERYVDHRVDAGRSVSTAKKELSQLIQALRELQRQGEYKADPKAIWPSDRLYKADTAKTRYIRDERELNKLLAAISPSFRDHLLVCVFTGIRRGELYRLRPEHIDQDHRFVNVPGTKTKRSLRRVPVGVGVAWDILVTRAKATEPDRTLFPGDPDSFTTALRFAAQGAGVEHLSPNDLRRTFTTWNGLAGNHLSETTRMLGHVDSKMARQVYEQMPDERLRQAAERYEAWLKEQRERSHLRLVRDEETDA